MDFCGLLADKERYSFADLELVVNESARNALQTRQPIASRHIEDAFSRLPPSITIEVIEDMSRE
jgi:SpoVK/Ycf46/Vps4 family AAA+-type ATPase